MDITYPYFKTRANFGCQPRFSETIPEMLDSIVPDIKQQQAYCLLNPVHREIQVSAPMSKHYINTINAEYMPRGMNHAEGGWPKEVNCNDEEVTAKYLRRIERDNDYVEAVFNLTPDFEHMIRQNNCIDMYGKYFSNMPAFESGIRNDIKRRAIYKDSCDNKPGRPISCIDWTHEDSPKIVVAYCDQTYSIEPVNNDFTCRVWDLENSKFSAYNFNPPSACWQLACSPALPAVIVAGLADGRVCIFDIRESTEPIAISHKHLAHRDPVTALLFIHSRTFSEFFTGSYDGQCMWYDMRKMIEPTDTLVIAHIKPGENMASMANAEPISVLQFDKAFPTRFYCGTATGLVINVNRRAKSHNEKLSFICKAQYGPIKSLHRSPCWSKVYITCGDSTVHIWSEDIISSPIITGTSQRYKVHGAVWAPHRFSSYMSVDSDGKFHYWDLLRKISEPIISIRVTKCPLIKIKPHPEGRFIALGDDEGSTHLMFLSDGLVESGNEDKLKMIQIYEREMHRERILEARVREIRLKATIDKETTSPEEEDNTDEADIELADKEYRQFVIDDMKKKPFAKRSVL